MATPKVTPQLITVAKALCDAWDPSLSTTQQLLTYAEAAIKAMIEPTEAMCEAGTQVGDSQGYGHISASDAERVWREMCQASLDE